MTPLILASSSPYRRELLQRLRLAFTCVTPDVDESALPGETPATLVQRLAIAKAQAVAVQHANALIIGSDQVAVLHGTILGKPGTHTNAVAQLTAARGSRMEFLTGLCLLNAATGKIQVDVVPYAVIFRDLTTAQIEYYLQQEQPYHCAGSFKSEGLGIALFERLEGDDPTALIGLPLMRLVRMLEYAGMVIIL